MKSWLTSDDNALQFPFLKGKEKITLDDATFNKAKTTLGKAQASNILRKYDNALMKRCQVSYDVKRGLKPLPTEMSEDTSLMSYSVF